MPMRVIVSGGGIAGPTLAWYLAKTGANITVVEKAPKLLPHGQNIDIKGAAVTAIKKMGLMDEFLKHHTTEKGTHFIDSKGKPYASLPVKEGSSHGSLTSEYEILRGDLAKILYEATRDESNVEYLFGTTISKVISNSEDAVTVALSDGRIEKFDLLVVADGQWSKVRKQVFPAESIKVKDLGMYAIYFTVPREPGDNDWWNIYVALKSRIIATRPDPHNTIRALLTFMPRNEAEKQAWQKASRSDRQRQGEVLREVFADAGWQTQRFLDEMDKAEDFYFQACQQIQMDKWSNNRVICLGDTAFAPTPLTGMGTSLAIIGGYLLAGELSKLGDGEHPCKALEAYEASFHPFVDKVQEVPSFIPGVAHPLTAWKRWLLQNCLWVMSKVTAVVAATPWLSKRLTQTNEDDDQGFPLPSFPTLDDKILATFKSEKISA